MRELRRDAGASGYGWFATLGGAALLLLLGFGVGLLTGSLFEQPDLVARQLSGEATDVALPGPASPPSAAAERSPGAAAPPAAAPSPVAAAAAPPPGAAAGERSDFDPGAEEGVAAAAAPAAKPAAGPTPAPSAASKSAPAASAATAAGPTPAASAAKPRGPAAAADTAEKARPAPAAATAEKARPAPPVSAAGRGVPAAERAPAPRVSAPPPLPARAPGFAVQVGAFGERSAADQLVASLRGQRFPAYVAEGAPGEGARFRVRVGPFPTREEASAQAGRLKEKRRLPTWVIREGGP